MCNHCENFFQLAIKHKNCQLTGVFAEQRIIHILSDINFPWLHGPHQMVEHNSKFDKMGVDIIVNSDIGPIYLQVKSYSMKSIKKSHTIKYRKNGIIVISAKFSIPHDLVKQNLIDKLIRKRFEILNKNG